MNTIWISAVVGQIHFPTLPQKRVNLAEIETRLTELQNSKAEKPLKHIWVNATYPEIIDHILVRYHQRHREQLQELTVFSGS